MYLYLYVSLQVFAAIKYKKSITYGARHLFDQIWYTRQHCTKAEQKAVFRTIQINCFFAHPENIILAMLGK